LQTQESFVMGTATSDLYEEIFLQSYENLTTKEGLERNDVVFHDIRE
jgi:hypothetical protein